METYYIPRVTRSPTASPIDWTEIYAQEIRDKRRQNLFESTVIVGVIVSLALIGLALRFLIFRNNESDRRSAIRTARAFRLAQQESEAAPSSRQDQASNVSNIAEMNVEELMVLFSETFEKNGRQTRLKASQIIEGNHTTDDVVSDNEDEDEEIQRHDKNNEDHPSIYLALESVRSILQSQRASRPRSYIQKHIKIT